MTLHIRRPTSLIPALLMLMALVGGTPTVTAAQSEATVVIDDRLRPIHLVVEPGTVVTWRNDDDERHRVRSREGPAEFDSGNLEPGESYTFTFTVEGVYPYHDERNDEDRDYAGSVEVRAPVGSAAPAASSASVILFDEAFNPPDVVIEAGGTVGWANEDGDDQHTVTSSDGAFDSGILEGGEAFTQAFEEPGTFPYFCAIHPEMTGTVTVTGEPVAPTSPAPATTSAPPDASTAADASTAPDASTLPDASTPPEPAAGTAVSIVDLVFEPAALEVPVGGTVSWTNDDPFDHTVTSGDGTFDSGELAAGTTFSWTFESPGTIEYACAIHPGMRGSVVVTPAAGASPTTSGAP